MYRVTWQLEGEVLRIELSGEITSQEIQQLNTHLIKSYLQHSERKIHLIVIGTNISRLPSNIADIANASRELAAHPKLGLNIYVDLANPMLDFLANTVAIILGHPYKMCKTLDEALIILERYKTNE